jgi:plastocyanin
MIFATALTLLATPLFVAAQYGYGGGGASTSTAPATSTSAASAAPSAPADSPGNINIDVAFQGNFVFNPSNVTAANGTKVTFWFPNSAVSHSVSQSSFGAPCTYLAAANGTSGGFDSGLQVAKQFTITITDDAKPIWYFCKQVQHCGMGMVGSINAPTTGNTFDLFKAAALAIGSSETTVPDNGFVSGGVNAQATASPAATASTTSPSSSPSSSSAMKFTVGAGAALIVAAAAFVSI